MTEPDDLIRVGGWLVRRASVDAIGHDDKDPDVTVVILRSGAKLYLDRSEAAEAWRVLDPDAGWQR